MKMRIKIYLILVAVLSLSSCNDWLNVEPQGEVDATKLLKTKSGYNAALGGIYYTLSSTELYGKEMTYGAMDNLVHYYDVADKPTHTYYSLTQYDYKNSTALGKINAIWKAFYTCIAQCNLILTSLEENRDEIDNSRLIEGEAYGLRAFCHMELFKLFGPVIRSKADLEKPSIAYRTNFDINALEFMPGSVVLEKAAQDLVKAGELMSDDPIDIVGRTGDMNVSALNHDATLNYRGARMNYYAVLGMMARLEQLRLNQDEAYNYAKKIIDLSTEKGTFKFVDKEAFGGWNDALKDFSFSSEMIFSVYIDNLWELAETFFVMNGKTGSTDEDIPIHSLVYVNLRDYVYLREPDGSADDIRFRYWFNLVEYYEFMKRRSPDVSSGVTVITRPEIGVFKLSEAYYIACEAMIGKDNSMALEYLNIVRRSRNLPDITAPIADQTLRDYLLREQRKEHMGDGLMFPIYKRLYAPIYVSSRLTVEPSEKKFVFPIPDDEYEFSPNAKPTE